MLILVLNSGSSSVKYQLYDMPKEICLAKGIVEKIGARISCLNYHPRNKSRADFKLNLDSVRRNKVKAPDHNAAIKLIIQHLLDEHQGVISSLTEINAVGHRVVHGGEQFKDSILINETVIKAIRLYSRLAPLHNPPNLAGIYACRSLLPHLRQVAVFDTAFHQSMPAYAYLYGLPYSAYKRLGIRRYGFHGTSHRYVAEQASKILHKPQQSLRMITCHLGNGCSITAIDRGKSVDTSMGFTPLEGLLMGTRCGDIDPAAVLYLMRKRRLDIAQIDELLNKASGLLGLSGRSNDMRDILRLARRRHRRATIALEVFIYRIKKYISAYIGVMNACDVLVFTAGIGENVSYVRRRIRSELSALIGKFKMRILVIPTNEELMIARDTYQLIRKFKPKSHEDIHRPDSRGRIRA